MSLKYVVAIIRPDVLIDLEEKLSTLHVRGITVTKVKGYGEYKNYYTRNHLTEHLKIEIFVEETMAEVLTDAILDIAHSDTAGAGIVAVMPVDKFFHIRTRSERLPDES